MKVDALPFIARRTIAPVLRRMYPYFSTCNRCRAPWSAVTSKTVQYSQHEGCFALCTSCWDELRSADARIPYYLDLIPFWEEQRLRDLPRYYAPKEDPAMLAEQITQAVIESSQRDQLRKERANV